MQRTNSRSDRRNFLAGAICSPLLGVPGNASANHRVDLDLTDPKARLRTYMLMRGALDEKLVVSCISCQYFGVVDGVMTPFYDLVAATFAKFRRSGNGGYDAVTFEIEYFIDRDTGDVLDRWRNPYSGETVTARHNDSIPMKVAIGPDLVQALPSAPLPPGTRIDRQTPRFDMLGGDVWAEETFFATIPIAGSRPMHLNETVTYHAKAADLMRPDATRATADVAYLGVGSFRPWQAMGERPGHMVGHGTGSSNIAIADLPPRWLAITRRRRPEALTDPAAYLEPLWRTL